MIKSFFAVVFFSFLFSPVCLPAQSKHFLYFQTEGKQPFYARLDKKLMSSSASGYLIIPKLTDGTYTIVIGFPKNENPEQNFVCQVDNKDAGYIIKNFGSKGWGLFNLQTMEVVMAGSGEKEKDVATTAKADAFSSMLSEVVNDPTIKQAEKQKEVKKSIAENKVTEPKAEPKEVKAVEEIKIAANEPQDKPAIGLQPAAGAITKIKVTADVDGVEMIYVDRSNPKPDTIRVFIPTEKANEGIDRGSIDKEKPANPAEKPKEEVKVEAIVQQDIPRPAERPETNTDSKSITSESKLRAGNQDTKTGNELTAGTKENDNKDSPKFLPIELPAPNNKADEKADPKISETVAPVVVKPIEPVVEQEHPRTPMINSDCKSQATDDDFLKLRKKMAAVDKEEEMIGAAKKYFKTKCFTTDQIKNLSVLFLKDAGKYNFFDLAYQFVSDSHNFSILEGQLTETYFINRFKAMIRH